MELWKSWGLELTTITSPFVFEPRVRARVTCGSLPPAGQIALIEHAYMSPAFMRRLPELRVAKQKSPEPAADSAKDCQHLQKHRATIQTMCVRMQKSF